MPQNYNEKDDRISVSLDSLDRQDAFPMQNFSQNERTYHDDLHYAFERLCDDVLNTIGSDETLSLTLSGEDSTFVRFNQGKIRQSTHVQQATISLSYGLNDLEVYGQMPLTLDHNDNRERVNHSLACLKDLSKGLPADPYKAPMEKHASTHVAGGTHTSYDLDAVFQKLAPHDAAGLWCSGPVMRGYANTKGTQHWFSADQFFLDYSLYTPDQKAVKKLLAGSTLALDDLDMQLLDATESLSLMKGPPKVLEPGTYRVYFSPSAVNALMGMLSWGAASYGAYKKGQSALKDLADGKKELSSKVTLYQDFSHGFMPQFNSYGATAPEKLTLIDQGKLAHFLVSERTAKEHNVPSNAAGTSEGIRSATLACGTLDPDHALKTLDRGIYIDHLHYLNWSDMQSGRITGMTRYACFWVENGEKVSPIKDMRFDETLYHFLGTGLVDLTTQHAMMVDTGTYDQRSLSMDHMPGMLVNDFHFTL